MADLNFFRHYRQNFSTLHFAFFSEKSPQCGPLQTTASFTTARESWPTCTPLPIGKCGKEGQQCYSHDSSPSVINPIACLANHRKPRAWTANECAALLETCRHLNGMVGQVPARVWWLSLVQTCLDTGERIGAITAAKWSWISGDWILVPAEHRKGGKRDRQYRLGELTLITLAAQRKYQRSDEVWHWPQSRTYLWTRFRAVLRKAGLPDDRRSSFHRLRRTTASVCHAAGLDASEALDHADRRTTRAYLDPRFARTTQAADVLADFLSNPPPRRDKRIG